MASPTPTTPSSTSPPAVGPSLWKRAVDSLDPEVLERLEKKKKDPITKGFPEAILTAAQARRQTAIEKRWRLKKPGGEEIIVRDVMERVIHWLHCFKAVGDNMVQHSPEHAALPWAAVRFLLQTAINYTEVEAHIMEDLELIAQLLARYGQIEAIYTSSSTPADLQNALVRAYASILTSLADSIKFLSEAKFKKAMKAPFRMSSGEGRAKLLAEEVDVLRFTGLIDGERLLKLAIRTADLDQCTEQLVEEQKYAAILGWLSMTTYIEHHEDIKERKTPGTGGWLLQHPEYEAWLQSSTCSMLLVQGIRGCGKTFLSCAVIEGCLQHQATITNGVPLAYFYCSRTSFEPDRGNATGVLRSLVRQLTAAGARYPKVHSQVLAAYDKKVDDAKRIGFEPRKLKADDCVDLLLAALADNPATIIIDAVDELDNVEEVEKLMDALDAIRMKSSNVVKVMITGRDGNLAVAAKTFAHEIRVAAAENHSDILKFIVQRVDKLDAGNLPQHVKDKITENVATGAGEMFQWADLQLTRLRGLERFIIADDLTKQLASTTTATLDELYSTVWASMSRLATTAQEIVRHTFSWLLYAKEPLSLNAFLEVIQVTCAWQDPSLDRLVKICCGFVYVDSRSKVFRFAHESVREFLRTQSLLLPHEGQCRVSLDCLKFLREPPDDELMRLEPTQAPYDYAVLYLGYHVSLLEPGLISDTFKTTVEEFFFNDENGAFETWMENVKTTFASMPRSHSRKVEMEVIMSDGCTQLYPICAFAMDYALMRHTWPPNFDWNQRNSHGHTALYVASYFGHQSITSLLLDLSADSSIDCGRLGSALQCAAYWGHREVVKILIGGGADPKRPGKYQSAIHAACSGDREDVVLMLLKDSHLYSITTQHEYDAVSSEIINAGFAYAMTQLQQDPLSVATPSDQAQQVATTIARTGEVNLRLMKRKLKAVGLTLADLGRFASPGSLAVCALRRHEDMINLLIDQGVDVDEPGDIGTPLRCASAYGHTNICRILLARGAVIDRNSRFGCALHAAAMKGHVATVELLLDSGADVNAQGGLYGTPLQAAVYQGHPEVVQTFINAKADISRSGVCYDAMHAAVESGQYHIVQMFLDIGFQSARPLQTQYGANPQASCSPSASMLYTPVQRSPSKKERRYSQPKTCVKDSFDPLDSNTRLTSYRRDGTRPSLLETAAALGHLDISIMLLRHGSLLNQPQDTLYGALDAASRYGQTDIIREMLKSDAGSSLDVVYPLYVASTLNHDATVQALLDNSRDPKRTADHFQIVLYSSLPGRPSIFSQTMQRLRMDIGEPQFQAVVRDCLPFVAMADEVEIVKVILQELSGIDAELLMASFKAACDAGSAAAASILFCAMEADVFPPGDLVNCVRLAVQEGHAKLLKMLLMKINDSVLEHCLGPLIIFAAGDGLLEILTILIPLGRARSPGRAKMLNEALFIAGCNGHYDVSKRLLLEGADPSRKCRQVDLHDILIARDETRRLDRFTRDRPQRTRRLEEFPEDPQQHAPPRRRDDQALSRSSWSKLRSLDRVLALLPQTCRHKDSSLNSGDKPASFEKWNAVEACLAGYARLIKEPELGHSQTPTSTFSTSWKAQGEAAHADTLQLLLSHVRSFRGNLWMHAICQVASFGPLTALELMLQRGADLRAATTSGTAIEHAVKRVQSPYLAVQAMVNAGAIQTTKKIVFRQLLTTAIASVDERSDSFPSFTFVDQVFESGSGAVVEFLMQRFPKERTDGHQWRPVFHMAAAAGRCEFVQLLIARGIDVNSTGPYYGTALQAACCYGRATVVEVLLRSGADSTIIGGDHDTALRAAVVGGSLGCVLLLLECETSPELAGDQKTAALHAAMDAERADIAIALIKGGACIATSLARACRWGNVAVVKTLLAAGGDGLAVDANTSIPCCEIPMNEAIRCQHLDVVRLLLDHDLNLMTNIDRDGSSLRLAASKSSPDIFDALLSAWKKDDVESLLEAALAAVKTARPNAALQITRHGREHFLPGNLLDLCMSACRTSACDLITALLEDLSQFHGLDLHEFFAGVDVRGFNSEAFGILLWHMPCNANMFVEACCQGLESIVQAGLDVGLRGHDEDSHLRPALFMAASYGHASVVRLLLETGSTTEVVHHFFGTPLEAALEGCVEKMLRKSFLYEDDFEYARMIFRHPLKDCQYNSSSWRSARIFHYPIHQLSVREANSLNDLVSLLLSHGALMGGATGKIGYALSMAVYIGVSEVVNELLTRGVQSFDGQGDTNLSFPLVVAIRRGLVDIAATILDTLPTEELDPGMHPLHQACSDGSLPCVSMLLKHGYSVLNEDDAGKTALQISLERLNSCKWAVSSMDQDPAGAIVFTILNHDPAAPVTMRDVELAAGLRKKSLRDAILEILLSRLPPSSFSKDECARLLERRDCCFTRCDGCEGRLTAASRLMGGGPSNPVTDITFVTIGNVVALESALESAGLFTITPNTLDVVGLWVRGADIRACMEVLLQRNPSMIPTQANMARALKARSWADPGGKESRRLIDSMLDRDATFEVTEELLFFAKEEDHEALLEHTKKGQAPDIQSAPCTPDSPQAIPIRAQRSSPPPTSRPTLRSGFLLAVTKKRLRSCIDKTSRFADLRRLFRRSPGDHESLQPKETSRSRDVI